MILVKYQDGRLIATLTSDGSKVWPSDTPTGDVVAAWIADGVPAMTGSIDGDTAYDAPTLVVPGDDGFGMAFCEASHNMGWTLEDAITPLLNADFDEDEHPRYPAGNPRGGQFMPSGESRAPELHPNGLPKNSVIDVSNWPGHNGAAMWGAKKIAMLEDMHKQGHYDQLKAISTLPKSVVPNKYQKAVNYAHGQLLLKGEQNSSAHVATHPEPIKTEIGHTYTIGGSAEGAHIAVVGVNTDGSIIAHHSGDNGWNKEFITIPKDQWNTSNYTPTGLGKAYGLSDLPAVPQHSLEGVVESINAAPTAPNPTPISTEDTVSNTPFNISGWKKVGGQLGSNPGGVYEAPSGQKWYVKDAKTGAIAKNEQLAQRLYTLAGARVLPVMLADKGDGTLATATRWVDKEYNINPENQGEVLTAHQDFGVHAWLANWDAVGLDNDNQAWVKQLDGSNKMTTMDVGGSILYRAQGVPKGDDWNNEVSEWNTMRDTTKNPQAAKVFGEMTPTELMVAGDKVAKIPDSVIRKLVNDYAPGDEKFKNELADRLIIRKTVIAGKVSDMEIVLAKLKESVDEVPKKSFLPTLPLPSSQPGFGGYPKTMSTLYGWAVTGENINLIETKANGNGGDTIKNYAKTLLASLASGAIAPPNAHSNIPAIPAGLSAKERHICTGLYFAAKAGDHAVVGAVFYGGKASEQKTGILEYKDKLLAAMVNGPDKAWGVSETSATPPAPYEDTPHKNPQDIKEALKLAMYPPKLPMPPIEPHGSATNPGAIKKFKELTSAFNSGSADAIKAVYTNPASKNIYAKQAVTYQNGLLAALGHSPMNAYAPPIPSAPGKPKSLKESELPTESEWNGPFQSSDKAHVEQNLKAMAELNKLALAGDLTGVKTFPVTPSAKVQTYRNLLVEKMSPAPVYEHFHGDLDAISKVAEPQKPKDAKERIGRFIILGDAGALSVDYGAGKTLNSTLLKSSKAKNDFDSILNVGERDAIRSYTNCSHTDMNANLSSGNLTPKERKAGQAIMKIANEIPEGGRLLRYFNMPQSERGKMMAAAGKVLQDPGIMSTQHQQSWSGSYELAITMGPGVRGLFVNNGISSHNSEHETLLPPNTRMVIRSVKEGHFPGGARVHIEAVVLPTLSYQFYA